MEAGRGATGTETAGVVVGVVAGVEVEVWVGDLNNVGVAVAQEEKGEKEMGARRGASETGGVAV